MKRILVVDDEESILKVVDYALAEAGYEVHTAIDGPGAEFMFQEIGPDLVILDVMLPGKSGLDVARDLRATSNVPIIMLSARGDEVDRILGLEFGADDYVTKPFSPRELVSRVTRHSAPRGRRIRREGLHRDRRPADRHAVSAGEAASASPCTSRPPSTASCCSSRRHPGKAYSRQAILSALWDESPVGDERAVDVHIHNIREKIEDDPKNPMYLLTVRGFGYRLREP